MEQIASFGYWLRRRRKALDLTQDALAQQAGCALGTLKKIETDERRPSRQLAERLADCLAIPAAERAAFVQAARAELATDRLAMSAQPIEQNDADTALPSPTAHSNNLPAQPNALIGREREIADVVALLRDDDVRLLTLTGPGGTGKTRLAIQAAVTLLDTFPDGIWFVNLAPIRDPALALPSIAQALGVIELPGQPIEQRLKAYLHAKQLLLLDNFEQVIDAAPQIAELLAAAPDLKALVTSRATLHIYGEHEYAVPPLALPPTSDERRTTNDDHTADRRDVIRQYESVRLFIVRARAAKADLTVTNDNAPAVAEICHRLDGLPLAIELAAARIKLFPPEALLARLDHSLHVLTGGPRDLPARQQTLRNTIEWSYNLLDEGEQALFRRLGVFVGGCTPESAAAVLRIEGRGLSAAFSTSVLSPQTSVLQDMASLIDKSLLRQEQESDGEPRFMMLETVREYALERLEERGEAETFYLRQATVRFQEAIIRSNNAGSKIPTPWAQLNLGRIKYAEGDIAGAVLVFEQMLALFREHDHWGGVAQTLLDLGQAARALGGNARAIVLYQESLPWCHKDGSIRDISYCLAGLAWVAGEQTQPEQAARLFGAAEAIRASVGLQPPPVLRAGYERDVAAIRVQLDADVFAAAWAAGRALTLEQAIAEALAGSVIVDRSL